jgi:glycosyltransferase involved in cell wall biosynthesis
MRIGLNLLHARPQIGGSWNYIGNMLSALGQFDTSNNYIAFVTAHSREMLPEKSNFTRVLVNLPGANRPQRILYENTVLQFLAGKYKLDCMHWFANTQAVINAVPAVVTIYDLLMFRKNASYSLLKQFYLRQMISATVRRAAVLLPMSLSTAAELQSRLNARPARLIVIPAIIDDRFTPAEPAAIEAFKAARNLPNRYWLYVAHFYPHKNHVRLLQSYAALKKSGLGPWPLVFRGDPRCAESEILETIGRHRLEKDVVFMPRLSPAELALLYSGAAALIFPSMYEGGGMPVAEAMACGCPIVAASIPAVRESVGDGALLFDPLDEASIGAAMAKLQMDPLLRTVMRKNGLAQVESFRSRNVVGSLLEAYSRAASCLS